MRHHLMEEPYAVIPPVRICAGYPTFSTYKYGGNEEIYGDRILISRPGLRYFIVNDQGAFRTP